MPSIKDHLSLIYRLSIVSLPELTGKQQDPVERFLFCALEKLSKIPLLF